MPRTRIRTIETTQQYVDPSTKPGIDHLFKINREVLDSNRFTDQVPDYFLCVICREVPLQPLDHNVNGCNIVMCGPCHRNYQYQTNKSCPNCRLGDVCIDFSPMNRILRVNYFETMILRCKNSPYCKETHPMSHINSHEQRCPYEPQPCPVSGCPHKIQRTELAKHIYEMGIDHVEGLLLLCMPIEEPAGTELVSEPEPTAGTPRVDYDDTVFSLFGGTGGDY